jgi:hypothetical protein
MYFDDTIFSMTATESPKTRTAASAAEKLELLRKQRDAMNARINAVEATVKTKQRKEDTRVKIIVGAALLANCAVHPETRAGIVAVLQKAVTAPRDREFLDSKGWLS